MPIKVREESENPQGDVDVPRKEANDNSDRTLGPLHEADLAFWYLGLGASSDVRSRRRAHYGTAQQNEIERPVRSMHVSKQVHEDTEEHQQVRVPIGDRVQKRTERSRASGNPRDRAIEHIERARRDEHQTTEPLLAEVHRHKHERHRDRAGEGHRIHRDPCPDDAPGDAIAGETEHPGDELAESDGERSQKLSQPRWLGQRGRLDAQEFAPRTAPSAAGRWTEVSL